VYRIVFFSIFVSIDIRLHLTDYYIFQSVSSVAMWYFYSIVPLRAVKKIIPSQIFEMIWAHLLIRRNEPLLRTCGMNLFVMNLYVYENTQNEANLKTEFRCAYLSNPPVE
jgi:hypothetical protein